MFEIEGVPTAVHYWPNENQADESYDMQTNVQAKKLDEPDPLRLGELTAKHETCQEENERFCREPNIPPNRMDRLLRVRAYLRLADVTHVETHRHEGQDTAHVDPLMLSYIEAHVWQTDGQVSLHDWLVVYARE